MVKQQLIMEAALELFAEQGIEATSVQQITDRCGISKGAFYLSFKSKEELIFGIIDHFMSQYITDIDRIVSEGEDDDPLLYRFFYATFDLFRKHARFARLFLKETISTISPQLLDTVRTYDGRVNRLVMSLVRRQFAHTDQAIHADLVTVIRAFSTHYAELFLLEDYEIELDRLCRALVEKTTIIAEHATIAFMTPDQFAFRTRLSDPSKEELAHLIREKLDEADGDPIVVRSLQLLQAHLAEPSLDEAVVQGLIRNIRTQPQCKWLAYMYQRYAQRIGEA